jgi:hypothetical protein
MIREIWQMVCGLQDMDLRVWMAKSNDLERIWTIQVISDRSLCFSKS